MKTVLALLSSLKLSILLLVLLLMGLAAGTIVESRAGVEAAAEWVYYAPWFLALEALFAVNVAASLAALFPWGRPRVGYLITHASLLLVLAGALVTYFFKAEGSLQLWEGERGNIITRVEHGQLVERRALPFSVKLVDFQIDRYPGTMRPAMFRSLLEITDPTAGTTYPASVWMNHPLEVQGYRLFQSSYFQEDGREASVLSVSRDPGQPIVFAGYTLLVLGMCIVLGTRIAARRRAAKEAEPSGALGRVAVALLAAGLAGPAAAASTAEVEALRRLPVQHDGRTMPLDTYAREAVWHVTGERSWQGADPAATLAGWLAEPRQAAFAPVIALGSDELAAVVGAEGREHVAFAQLLDNAGFGRLISQARSAGARGEPRRGVVADAEKLLERAVWMQEIIQGQAVRAVAPAGDPAGRWTAPEPATLGGLLALAQGPRPGDWPAAEAIDREITYNRVRPTRIAWIVLALALALSVAGWWTRRRALGLGAAVLLVTGFAVMSWAIAVRWAIAGWIPATNMYESLLFLGWGVGLFAVVAFAFIRNRLLVLNASAGAALAMALTDLLPMDGFIHPPPPVLKDTIWLGIHVPVIMVGYAVLALGVVIAHMQIVFGALPRRREELVAAMADLNYWYMFVGSILLIAGILTGSIWAASSWGRYWGWDPKEVWSLVAWLAYMAILHGRVDRLLGQFGVAAISIVAFQTILMTYLGVNFVLGTGLHSYGFGDSPVVKWMALVAAAEAAFLAWGWAAHRRGKGAPAAL